jgi:hypothetical protein
MGFVGINVSEMRNRLKEFEITVQRSLDIIYEGGSVFFTSLGKCWYSPNAVNFSNIYGPRLFNSTVTDVLNYVLDYSNTFVASCNNMLGANGVMERFAVPTFHVKGEEFPSLKESGPSGEVGMDISSISPVVQDYNNHLQFGLDILESVRTDFPIYDQDASIQLALRDSFNALVDKIKLDYKETMQALLTEINNNQTNLQTSANQAASTIQSTGVVR